LIPKIDELTETLIKWQPCYRVIPSRYPPIKVYERVAEEKDFVTLVQLESLTNPRIRDEIGSIELVPKDEKVFGKGAGYIMAAFTHLNPIGSRFSDGTFGVYYAAKSIQTAIKETVYHREIFLKATNEGSLDIEMRLIKADLKASLHDLRDFDLTEQMDEYSGFQKLAYQLKSKMSYGVIYKSFRDKEGECVGVFRPSVLSNARSDQHYVYAWNGSRVENVYEKKIIF
jgi:hypothetical protein